MSINLTSLAQLGAGYINQAVNTAGTTITVESGVKAVVNKQTVFQTDSVKWTGPAIIAPASSGAGVTAQLPTIDVKPTDWMIVAKNDAYVPLVGEYVRVGSSLQGSQVTRLARVLGPEFGVPTVGVAVIYFVRPE